MSRCSASTASDSRAGTSRKRSMIRPRRKRVVRSNGMLLCGGLRGACARASRGELRGVDGRRRARLAQRTHQALRGARRADRRAEIHHRRVPVVRRAGRHRGDRQRIERSRRQRAADTPTRTRRGGSRGAGSRRPRRRRSSNANARTAAAVYAPMPGSARSAAVSSRKTPAVPFDDRARERVQPHGAAVVAEPAPRAHDVAGIRRRERLERRKPRDERVVERDHALDLRLLQHELAHDDAVRIARRAPRQVRAAVPRVPREQRRRRKRPARRQRAASPMRRMPSSIARAAPA